MYLILIKQLTICFIYGKTKDDYNLLDKPYEMKVSCTVLYERFTLNRL